MLKTHHTQDKYPNSPRDYTNVPQIEYQSIANMNDPNLNVALKWAIENSDASANAEGPRTQMNSAALAALLDPKSHMSDADYMKESMIVIKNQEAELQNRVVAFENFQLLIENLDNANMLEPLELWTPLVEQLDSEHAELREWAAWSCGTAVQNNIRTQKKLLVVGAIPILVRLATEDPAKVVRKRAITALSSAVRNFQPNLDATLTHIPADLKPHEKLDANDMESVDILINKLRATL